MTDIGAIICFGLFVVVSFVAYYSGLQEGRKEARKELAEVNYQKTVKLYLFYEFLESLERFWDTLGVEENGHITEKNMGFLLENNGKSLEWSVWMMHDCFRSLRENITEGSGNTRLDMTKIMNELRNS